MTTGEAAAALGVTAQTVRNLADKGDLACARDARGNRTFDDAEVEAIRAARGVKAAEPFDPNDPALDPNGAALDPQVVDSAPSNDSLGGAPFDPPNVAAAARARRLAEVVAEVTGSLLAAGWPPPVIAWLDPLLRQEADRLGDRALAGRLGPAYALTAMACAAVGLPPPPPVVIDPRVGPRPLMVGE